MARPGGSGPPLSFKTVPGRHRTQKWNYAKQYDYSGDDWGGYDAYDDYGEGEPPQQQQQYSAPPAMGQQPNWSPQGPAGPASAGPYAGLPSQQRPGRQMSFDEQEERRQFSAGTVMYGASGIEGPRGVSPSKSATSSQGKRSGEYRQPRDFTNPEQVPPPLNTGSRGSPALSSVSGPATAPVGGNGGSSFPPRKSSVSNNDSPASEPARASEKELPTPPFVRPADIYKRIAEEREKERRASESSGRPSMDDINRPTDSPGNLSQVSRDRRPLSAVDEGPDMSPQEQQQSVSVPQGFGEPREAQSEGQQSAVLPSLTGVSSFGNDRYPSGKPTEEHQTPTSATTARSPTSTSTASMQTTPIATRALDSSSFPTSSSDLGQQPPDSLTHQPSQGYRSVVNRAFDHSANSGSGSVPDTPITRDNSQSTTTTSDVSRSNTDSTSNISPIMSRVPSAATAQMQRQQAQAQQHPTITEEEPRGGSISPPDDSFSTSDAGVAAAGVAGVAATGAAAVGLAGGYRRNFSPPSNGSSPARTPAVDTSETRRFSEGLAAETILPPSTEREASSIPDQGVEMMPNLISSAEGETPASEVGEMQSWRDLPSTGRARAGTDYSTRESDIADAVNKVPSPEQPDAPTMSPAEAASAERAEQNLFLQTHRGTPTSGTPTTQFPAYPGFGGNGTPPPRTVTPVNTAGSGRASPAKSSRVRELTDRFQQIHEDSRRNSQISVASSKSSWSRFGGNSPKRQGTQDSIIASESNYDATEDVDRPEREVGEFERPGLPGREESFRPKLPGGWDSFRGDTPAEEVEKGYSPVTRPGEVEDDQASRAIDPSLDTTTPRASYEKNNEPAPDFAPTSRATPPQQNSQFAQVKDAGSALGASILATAGMSHGTRDFGSSSAEAEPVDQPEMRPKPAIGAVETGLQAPQRPWLERGDTEGTTVTDIESKASSVPPTPPAKDTPPAVGGFAKEGDYNYFSGVPLRTKQSPELSKSVPTSALGASASADRPAITPAFSVQSRASDLESDRLRKEIVRSLDSAAMKQKIEEDTERTQDALDAPGNMQRVDQGRDALPPAEQGSRPLLDQRFSWEKTEDFMAPAFGASAFATGDKDLPPPPTVREPEPEPSPEIKPEMPYERPRSRGLHIMNADSDDEVPADAATSMKPTPERDEALDAPSRGLSVATSSAGPVSPITKSQENLHLTTVVDATRDGGEGLTAPSPVASEGKGVGEGSLRLPSYYMLDIPGLEGAGQGGSSKEASDNVVSEGASSGPKIEDVDRPSTSDGAPPRPVSKDASTPTSPTSKQKIPPFREILAIKSTPDRIRTFDSTRQTFADMNTGLSDWLSGMLAQNPELASLSTPHGGYGQASERLASMKGHKQSPSLAKFTRQFSSSNNTPSPAYPGHGQGQGSGDYQPGAEPIPPPKTTPSKDGSGAVDMDELKQRGKDLMKNASVLGGKVGGKASAGAKGLLAKGKNRFGSTRESRGGVGGSKDLSSNSNSNSSSTLTSIPGGPKVIDRSNPDTILQPTPVYISRAGSQSSSIVPTRSQNQTPSSISSNGAGNPLSRTLSRLRGERSRSKSGSGSNSRQGSRPRSLIVGASELGSIQDTSPVAARVVVTSSEEQRGTTTTTEGSGLTVVSQGITETSLPTVISPWNEPDDFTGSHPDVEGRGLPDRLGVLPSPTAGSFSRSINSRPGTAVASSAEAPGGSLEPGAVLNADKVLAQDKEDNAETKDGQDIGGVEESKSRTLSPPQTPVAKQTEQEERDELYDVTPIVSRSAPTTTAATMVVDDDPTPKVVQEEWQSSAIKGAAPGEQAGEAQNGQDAGMTIEEIARFAGEDDTISGAETAIAEPEATPADSTPTGPTQDVKTAVSPPLEDLDSKSDVSAEDNEESGQESKTETARETPSKRSSVSSLGDRQPRDDPQDVPVIMSSQAVPAGPIYSTPTVTTSGMASDAPSGQQERFMNRTYLSRPEIPRPLSYEPRERDSTGEIVQETLNSPAPIEYADESRDGDGNRPFEANFTSLSRHRKQSQNSPTADRRSKRLSGIFADRGVQLHQQSPTQAPVQAPVPPPPPPPQPQPMVTRAPPASFMPDGYGLGDLRDLHEDAHDDVLDDDLSRQNSKQGRRKSGFWDALKRNPSATKEDSSRRSSGSKLGPSTKENIRPPPPSGWANDPRRMPVEQPQRAFTTATEPDKKKKRFSGLGSIFGRSSTTGHKTDKSKKLSKSQDLGRDNSQIHSAPSGGRIGGTEVFMVPKAPPPNTGWIDPYAMTGRPPPASGAGTVYPYGQVGRVSIESPPPEGRYGPMNNVSSPPGPPAQSRSTPPPNFSRLPSQGQRSGVPINQIPQAYRPVDGPYNAPTGPMQPAGGANAPRLSLQSPPPMPPLPMQGGRMSYPTTQPGFQPQQEPILGPERGRAPSSPSTEHALSPQISGQSEWLRSDRGQRGSMPTISPVDSKPTSEGYPPGRTMRVGSIGREMARSPAREYSDQQTPFVLSIPQGSGQAQSTRTSYYARQRRGKPSQPTRDALPEDRGHVAPPSVIASSQGYPLLQQPTNSTSIAEEGQQDFPNSQLAHTPDPPQAEGTAITSSDTEVYAPPPGPPPSHRTRNSQREYIASFQRSQPNVNVRTPRDDTDFEQPKSSNANPYLSLQLPNLGGSTRRDDYPDDERIEMKSASYPGQEWIPSQWD